MLQIQDKSRNRFAFGSYSCAQQFLSEDLLDLLQCHLEYDSSLEGDAQVFCNVPASLTSTGRKSGKERSPNGCFCSSKEQTEPMSHHRDINTPKVCYVGCFRIKSGLEDTQADHFLTTFSPFETEFHVARNISFARNLLCSLDCSQTSSSLLVSASYPLRLQVCVSMLIATSLLPGSHVLA